MEKQEETNQEKKQKASRNRMETSRIIKEAARDALYEESIASISINKLERVSGKSKKLIYNYFGDLNGLLKEVYR